ncbi:MAG: DNA double-strand break repair nuclease NurA [Candidatus Jordarchaeales archaeon]
MAYLRRGHKKLGFAWNLEKQLESIASEVKRLEKGRDMLVSVLRRFKGEEIFDEEIKKAFNDIVESKLAYPSPPADLTGLKVASVDGGLISRSLRVIDVIAVRAVAVIFKYEVGGRVSAYYYPEEHPPPKITFNADPFSQMDFDVSAGLERLSYELEVAINVQKQYDIDLLLLDGSLLPQASDKPYTPGLEAKYLKVLGLFEKLYRSCVENGVSLAGVVKDTRSTRFVQLLSSVIPTLVEKNKAFREILSFDYRLFIRSLLDSELFFRLLDKGERSMILRYSDNPNVHPVLKDVSKDWRDRFYITYLKPAELDRPIRVEFLATGNPTGEVRKVASAIMALSMHHPEYALPSVQLEAHAQAKLAEKEMDFICDQLAHKIGIPPSFLKPRDKMLPV